MILLDHPAKIFGECRVLPNLYCFLKPGLRCFIREHLLSVVDSVSLHVNFQHYYHSTTVAATAPFLSKQLYIAAW